MHPPRSSPAPLMMSISAVERDTGLSKDTLRVWERRYQFPMPERDGQSERCYPLDQVEKLRLVKRLLDVGHRPSRVISLALPDLQALSERTADAQGLTGPTRRRAPQGATPEDAAGSSASAPRVVPMPVPDVSAHCLALAVRNDPIALQRELRLRLAQMGLHAFTEHLAAPLVNAVGQGWLRGQVQVFQEHWVSHCLQQCLHGALHSLPSPQLRDGPTVLLSTLPGEQHGLGLLMVEAWLASLGARVVNLGPQTPVWDLLQACAAWQADVVALSFSSHAPAPLVSDGLADLRSKLPPGTALWAGGAHPLLQRKPPVGIDVFPTLPDLGEGLAAWRRQHPTRHPLP